MWQSNWAQTREHFVSWWQREGLVLGMPGALKVDAPVHEEVPPPPEPSSVEAQYTDASLRAWRNHYQLSRQHYPLDTLPIAATHIGPGSLALLLGSEPGFSPDTVWFHSCLEDCEDPESLPPLVFDASNRWWELTRQTVSACAELGRGKYLVGCPDLIENIDILAALRGPQTLLVDMIERPEWVEKKVFEINEVWFQAYQGIYDIIRLEDGSATFGAYHLWAPGKVAKVQCDASAMISPEMFRRFVVPALSEQCRWLDYSMYHLDGTQAIVHLDALLEIDALDAIEWTPQAGIESGGHARWIPLYQRVLAAGKSVQILHVKPQELQPLLEAIGTRGVYIFMSFANQQEADQAMAVADRYRNR